MRRLNLRARALWRSLWRANQLDAAMDDEMRFHIDMEAERLSREHGLEPQEARRRARVAFGGIEKYKEEGRDTRGVQWIDAIALDVRLAARMLVKHRGLTLVGGFAIAVAIAVGATSFEVIAELLHPALPLADGDRVVAVRTVSSTSSQPERRVLHDFVVWREQLVSLEHLSAFRTVQHNLVSGSAPPEPVKVAEMTASGFTIAGTPPLLGRHLLPADEREGAPPVVVIGHQVWRSHLGGDQHIVGRTITFGGAPYSVVGVMPDGFKFPVDHQFWMPLRSNPLALARLQGPELYVFGRLARGATVETAQAELSSIGERTAAAYPATHERLRPVVLPYTREHLDLAHPRLVWVLRIAQLLIGTLTFVVAINLAILVYARTVARLGEIAVRTALGASRRRILVQLFLEALALSGVGAAAGLLLAAIALGRIATLAAANGNVPFWIDFELSVATAIYAVGLAVLAAVVIGVVPGFKATGIGLNAQLRELSGRTCTRLGQVWTGLVVTQVAVAVAVLPFAVFMAWQVIGMERGGPGFAADKFVVATVSLSEDTAPVDASRRRARQHELMSRLAAEPGVASVTFSSSIPGFAGDRRIQFETGAIADDEGTLDVSTLSVAVDMFDIYGTAILAGRAFTAADVGAANTVIVNRTFSQAFAANRSPLGVRFRYLRPAATSGTQRHEWYEIVGVVRDFPSFPSAPGSGGSSTVYHPIAPGEIDTVAMSVRFSGNIPEGIVARIREIGAEVEPALQMRRVVPLAAFYQELQSFWRHLAWALAVVTASVLLLSAAGIYALMSFTVEQRTREIGIRKALGALPHQLLLSVFGRAVRQLALGLLIGSLLSGGISLIVDASLRATGLLLTVAAIMLAVGVLAALGPARRSLGMPASAALRVDA